MSLRENLREKLRDAVIDITYLLVRLGLIKLSKTEWTVWHLKRELQRKVHRVRINKIAFLLVHSFDFDHAKGVLRCLTKGSFDIVVCYYKNPFLKSVSSPIGLKVDEIKTKVTEIDPACRVRTFNEVIENAEKYSICVCVHSNITRTGRYKGHMGMSLIADKMELFGFSFHILTMSLIVMKYCSKIFCIGSLQASCFKSLPIKAEILDYGSPRFDDEFELSSKIDRKFLDPQKKTICFLPTHNRSRSAIGAVITAAQRFSRNYNVVIGYYVFDLREKKEMEDLVISRAPSVQLIIGEDNTKLMPIADFVFCDCYAGSVLTAVRMDKNIVMLEDKKPPVWFVKRNEIEELTDRLGTFSVNDYDKIAATLKDDAYWERQRVVRAELRKQFFSFHKEPSGKLIADELMRDLKAASVT